MYKYEFVCIYKQRYFIKVARPKTCSAERAPANIPYRYQRMLWSTRPTEHVSGRVESWTRHFELMMLVLRF